MKTTNSAIIRDRLLVLEKLAELIDDVQSCIDFLEKEIVDIESNLDDASGWERDNLTAYKNKVVAYEKVVAILQKAASMN